VLVRKAARIRSKTIYERLDQKGVGFSEGPGTFRRREMGDVGDLSDSYLSANAPKAWEG
jgi:hypothetical protein